MSEADRGAFEKTYRAIGRFIFEFSQVEYTLRYSQPLPAAGLPAAGFSRPRPHLSCNIDLGNLRVVAFK